MADDYIRREDAYNAACDGADEWDGGSNQNRCSKIAKAIYGPPAAAKRYGKLGELADRRNPGRAGAV